MTNFVRAFLTLVTLSALLVLVAGCPEDETGDDDTADDDTADDDTHEAGCITVNGEVPGYASLPEAVEAAQGGDVIAICPGTYVGSTLVEKSLTIIGEDPATTILEGDLNEIALTVRNTDDVTLSGVTVRSSRTAVTVELSGGVQLSSVILDDSGQYGLDIAGSEVSLTDVQLSNHPFAGVVATGSTVTAQRCSFDTIGGYGLRLVQSEASVSECEFHDISVPEPSDDFDGTGLYSEDASGPVVVDSTSFDACPRVAIYAFGTDLEVSGCSMADTNYGVIGVGPGETGSVVSDNLLEEVRVWGIYLSEQDSDVTGNTVTVTEPGDNTYGILVGNPDGSFVVSDNVVSGYGRGGIWVQYPYADPAQTGGSATVSGNVVSDIDYYGLLVTAMDSAEITDNQVSGIAWGGSLVDGAYGDGLGLYIVGTDDVTLADNEMSDVDVAGLVLIDTTFVADGDVVTDNHLFGVYVQEASGTFTDLTMDNNAIWGINAITAQVELENATISNTIPGVPPEQWGEPEPYEYSAYGISCTGSQLRIDGSTFSDNDYMHVYSDTTDFDVQASSFYGPVTYGIYASYPLGSIATSVFQDATTAVYVASIDSTQQLGDFEIADCTFTGTGNGVYAYYLAETLTITGCTFEQSVDVSGYDGYGIHAVDYMGGDGAVVEVHDNTFDQMASSAIYVYGVEVDVSGDNGVTSVDNGQPAVRLETVTGTVSGLSVSGSSGYGLQIQASDLTVQQCTLIDSESDNIYINASTVRLLDNLAISEGKASGIRLEGEVGGTIRDNTIADNEEYGISCGSADVRLDQCANQMSGNLLGDFLEESGCLLGCVAY